MPLKHIEIHHPTSLSHEVPQAPVNGSEFKMTNSMVRFPVKINGKIRVIFKKNVKESTWTYKLTTTKTGSFNVGGEVTASAGDKDSAKMAICSKLTARK